MIKNVVVGLSVSAAIVVGIGCTTETVVVTATDTDAGQSPDKGAGSGADGSAGSTGSNGGQSGADAGKPAADSGKADARGGDAATPSGTCAPADVSSFTPAWKGPTALAQHKCTQAQIDAYFTDCLSPMSTNAACTPHAKGADAACSQCIMTPDTAAKLGPIILKKGLVNANIAGCIAAVEKDTAGTGCGPKVQAAGGCDDMACAASCPVTDEASFKTFQQCVSDAEMDGCATYAAATSCVSSLAGDAATCTSGTSFEETYKAIVPKFCL